MRALLTITDLTRMQGDRVCVAGVLPDRSTVRPMLPKGGITEDWLRVPAPWPARWWRSAHLVRPFVAVEVQLRRHAPAPPHCEDWEIAPTRHRIPWDALAPERREGLLASLDDGIVANIFGAAIHTGPGWYLLAGMGTRSLGTVQPQTVERVGFRLRENGRYDYRLTFTDRAGSRYTLAVTDLAFRRYLAYLHAQMSQTPDNCAAALTHTLQVNRTYLRIGLARGWDCYPDRCYLQITGVYTFPDYLGGRCFADFPEPATP